MFFLGENDHRFNDDFRPELHDSDGLLIHSGTGEWIWRPLRNPVKPETSSFFDHDLKGFGLLQRDRDFDHYQDLDLAYEQRPSYFVEPRDSWGEGHVDLVELPTQNETNDNIVASFAPKDAPEPNKPFAYAYRLTASLDLTPGFRRTGGRSTPIRRRRRRSAPLRPSRRGRAASSSISAAASCPSIRSRSGPRRGRALDEPGQDLALVHRAEPSYQGLSGGDRRGARTRPDRPICALFCGRNAGSDRDLDLSLARRIEARRRRSDDDGAAGDGGGSAGDRGDREGRF